MTGALPETLSGLLRAVSELRTSATPVAALTDLFGGPPNACALFLAAPGAPDLALPLLDGHAPGGPAVRRDPGGAVAFGAPLVDGARFAVVVDGPAAADRSDDELLTLAAATRVGLLTGRPGQAEATADLLTRLEQAVLGHAGTLERAVERLDADGRLVDRLRDAGQRLTTQLDLDTLVQDATDSATAATGAAFGAFFYNLVNEYGESYTLYTLSGVPRAAFEGFPMPRNTQVFAPTFTGLGPVRSADIVADPRYGHNAPYHGMPEGHLPVRSYLAVPVISPTSHEVLGGFFFGHSDTGRFTEEHERLAEGLAGYTAIALDNARLYARERTIAIDLQRRMLPEVTSVPGFSVVARYLPAATEVGGDWLDVIELTSGRTAFVIGDVMGRGVPAATTMAQIRTAVRAYALLDLPPGEVLRHTSKLAAEMPGRQFITCVYAVHDPVDGTLTYANAGHPPPAVLGADGTVRFLHERLGMPLRVGEAFTERVVEFPGGSALVLYTDGLVERRGRSLPEGIAELESGLRDSIRPDDDHEAAWDTLIDRLTGGAHDDDVALLFARDTGQPRQVAMMPLTTEPRIASIARRFIAGALADWRLTDDHGAVAMVATELISNAVRHSGTPIALRIQHTNGRLVIEVVDADDRQPRRLEPTVTEENHRGLLLVDSLSQSWGTRRTPTGKVVWAEVPLAG